MTAKPVVFLAFANDRELRSRYLRNLPEEERRLRAQLERAQREGLCELLVRQNVTREQLFAVFQSADYRDRVAVFHYGGHANGYALLLEEESGAGKVAHAAGLADLLGAQRGLRFVFLNGCATEGHARGLLDAGVAAVLVTSQKIRDEAALDVASHFYAGLGSGASLERAYAEAKAAVATDRGSAGPGEAAPEHWPWSLYIKEGADERIKGWNLPQAAGDPLFGLPEIPPGDLHECPYRHLQPFGRDHAELFFGRGKDIRALYERVTDPHAAPILLLYGGSGVGKSSLLEAGLIPRLEQSHEVIYQRRNQDLGLWGTLLKALEADEEIPEAAQRCWQQRERQSGKPLDMILDQVEEVFTRPYPNRLEELGDFLGAVKTLLGDRRTRPQGKLVLGFRKEWLSELQQGLSRRELPYGSIPVEPLDRAGLIEAIAGPIRSQRLQQHYGLSIEDGLPESIADTLRDDPQSPLAPTLQVLLAKLWAAAKKRDPAQPRFDRALYQDRKREGLLLGDYLDQRLTAIEEQHPQAVQSGLVLDLLAYYTTARGTAEARSEEDLLREYAHQEHQLRGLIDACQAGYLLLPIKGGGTRLGHDTLAPLIRERYEESDRPGQRARRVLESRTPDWADGKEGTVLDQADLDQVEAGLEGMRILTADEQRLVNASRRERDRRARQRKLFRALGAIAIVAIIISAAFSSWQAWEATKARRQAEHEARITLSRQLTAQARSLADQYPQRSLLLAVEAVRRPLEADGLRAGWAETLLRERLAATGGVPLRGRHDSEVNDLAFDPQGRWLASAGADGKVQLWNPNQPSVELLELHGGSYEPVEWSRGFDHLAFNREGRWLAAEAGDGRTRLWDLHKPAAEPLELSGPDEPVHYVAFDPQNRWVTVLGGDGRVRLWDLDKPAAEPITLQGEESIAVSLAFDPRGRWLADLKDGAARLWNLDKPAAEPITLHGDEHVASNLAFDPQGRWLATASFDSTVQLWDLKQLSAMPIVLNGGELQVQGGFPTSLVFDSQGRWLVIGTATENMTGGTVGLWDLANPQTEPVLLLEDREFWTLQLGPQGRWLATVNSDGSARVLDLNHSEAGPLLLRGHEGGVRSLVFDPNGGSLVTGGADGTIRYWSLPLHVNEPIELQGKQAKTMETETAGRWLAMWEKDGAARIWDLSNPEAEPAILNEHPGPVYSLTFDPQGGWLAAVVQEESGHASVRLWNLANPDSEPVLLYELEEEYLDILALDPLKRWLATGGFARPVRLYDLAQTGAEPVVLHWHDVRFLTFDPRGRWLAGETVPTIDSDDRVLLWDSANPEAEPVVLNGMVYLSGFDPEGRWMVTAGGEGAVLLWDLNQLPMAPVKLLPHEGHPAVAFDPLGRWLATVSLRNPVRLWNLAKPWAEPLALQGGRWRADEFMFFDPALDWPLELTFDSQGRWLTTGSRLWDLANLGAEPAALVEDGNVFSAAFDPQGHWLAVSTLDSSVQLFSLANPEAEPTVLKGFDYNVDLAFDTKGRWIVTTSDGGATQLWELRAHELLRKACRTAGRNLTRQEWSLLLGATDYRATCPEYPIPEK